MRTRALAMMFAGSLAVMACEPGQILLYPPPPDVEQYDMTEVLDLSTRNDLTQPPAEDVTPCATMVERDDGTIAAEVDGLPQWEWDDNTPTTFDLLPRAEIGWPNFSARSTHPRCRAVTYDQIEFVAASPGIGYSTYFMSVQGGMANVVQERFFILGSIITPPNLHIRVDPGTHTVAIIGIDATRVEGLIPNLTGVHLRLVTIWFYVDGDPKTRYKQTYHDIGRLVKYSPPSSP